MRTTVLLVRHGHVEGIDQPTFRGRLPLPLTALGLRQAARTGEYIPRIANLDVVYSSPLARCIATGTIIGAPLGLAPIPEPGLTDIDYGAWEGRVVADVARENAAEVSTWFRAPEEATIPGGETLRSLSDRVRAAMAGILEKNAGNTVVVVGHDSVNRVMLLHALGLPLSRYWHLGQSPGAVNRLEHADGDWTIHSVNETGHLVTDSVGVG